MCSWLCARRDDSVRGAAWQMVGQLPLAALLTALAPAAWRSLFDAALVQSPPHPQQPAGGNAQAGAAVAVGLRPTLQQPRARRAADAAANAATAAAGAAAAASPDAPTTMIEQVLLSRSCTGICTCTAGGVT